MIPVFHHHPPAEHVLIYKIVYPSLNPDYTSLFMFSTDSSIRMLCYDVVTHSGWFAIMLLCTLLSCVVAAIDDGSVSLDSSTWRV